MNPTEETKATPVQAEVEQIKNLLAHIDATYRLLTEGTFPGAASGELVQVLGWLERFRKSVMDKLPTPPVEG